MGRAADIVRQGLKELGWADSAADADEVTYDPTSGIDFAAGGGATFPDEWTVAADGSLDITPSDPNGHFYWRDSDGNWIVSFFGDPASRAADLAGGVRIGNVNVDSPNFAALRVYGFTGSGAPFTVFDSDFNPVFQVQADDTVHIKTGGSVVADL